MVAKAPLPARILIPVANPMTAEEVRAKFRQNASLALGDEEVSALEDAVLGLEERRDVRGVMAGAAVAVAA